MLLPILNCVFGEKHCLCADRQSHILCEENLQKRRSAGVSLMTMQPAELIHIWGKRATNCNSITLRWPSTLGPINAGKFTINKLTLQKKNCAVPLVNADVEHSCSFSISKTNQLKYILI